MNRIHSTHNPANRIEKERLTMRHAKNIGTIALTATLALALAAPAAAADYTVRKGDSLWKIAQEQLGSGRKWTDIHAVNRDTVKNPDMIQIGQVLHIPGEAQVTTQPEQSRPAAAAPNPQPEQAPAAEELTQTDGAMAVTDLDKTEANRKLVQDFLYDVMQGNNLEKTPDYFDGDTYIQHNTGIADGVSGPNAALAALAEQGIAMVYDEVHQVLAQGNFVLAVSEGTFGGAPTAYYDLWRVEDGKIAEHWDVMETIAGRSAWANENGKF